MKKHHFTPDGVVPMEERALLSGFSFPGGANTLGMKGAFVLTSRTYGQIQAGVDSAIQSFTRNTLTMFDRQGGFTNAFYAKIGVGTYGQGAADYLYGRGTALANVDARMRAIESRLPFGGGRGMHNPTGGSGLSNLTALTSVNPGLGGSVGNMSVAELLDNAVAVSSTRQELSYNLNTVRTQVLAWHGAQMGVLPSYVAAFGPGGARYFGTRNT
jgi:hypothetical protein